RDVLPHRSQLFVPIVAKERVIGGCGRIGYERACELSESELALMEAIANHAGVAIDNARLFEENRRQVQELSVLLELSQAVTGQLERAALIDAIHAQVARVLDARNMVVALHDEERHEFEVVRRLAGGVPGGPPPLRASSAAPTSSAPSARARRASPTTSTTCSPRSAGAPSSFCSGSRTRSSASGSR